LNEASRQVLISKVLDAATKRCAELTDYLAGRDWMPGDEPVMPPVYEGVPVAVHCMVRRGSLYFTFPSSTQT
jgi:hypothetical protein